MRIDRATAALSCVVMVMTVMIITGAAAQRRGSTRQVEKDDLPPSVPPPVSTLAPVRGISGPRLEPGAVLCRTDSDLRNRAEVNRRRADGDVDAGDPLSGCRLLNQERGVEVVSRQGLGMVQVRVKPNGELGWTDAYIR